MHFVPNEEHHRLLIGRLTLCILRQKDVILIKLDLLNIMTVMFTVKSVHRPAEI